MPITSDSIKVAVRARPFLPSEIKKNLSPQWCIQNNAIYPIDDSGQRNGELYYHFDHVFQTTQTNREIYDETVKDFVDSALNGVNATVFAYGQTSSGKTYTMLGDKKDKGIVPLTIDHIFDSISDCENRRFFIRVSYIEIYNEKINDLLDPKNKDIKIREDNTGTISLNNIKEEIVSTQEQVYECLKHGNENRHIGTTNMNDRSSRSHAIFKIVIESTEISEFEGPVQISNLNLVDLAGSERVAQTKATGVRLKEGGHINKSLSVLALVMRQLSDGQDFVNFRDSKLTRLLQHSLGGNSKTLIIATITLSSVEYTTSTLFFAQTAKQVKNKPHVNEIITDTANCKRYAELNVQLHKRLEELTRNLERTQVESSKEIARLQEQMQMLESFQSGRKTEKTTVILKRRHTIGHLSQKGVLDLIVEEPDEGVQPLETIIENQSLMTTLGDLATPVSCKKPQLLSAFSTPKRNLRTRIQALQQDYDDLVTYTKDEKNVLTETSKKVEILEEQLLEEKRKLIEYQKVRKVEEEFITTHLNNRFKVREEQLLNRITTLEKQLNSCNEKDLISCRSVDNSFLNAYRTDFSNYEDIKYLYNQLITLKDILERCSLTENFDDILKQTKSDPNQEIVESFNAKIKTLKDIIEAEIWKQINSFDQIVEVLREPVVLPNEIESFDKLLKELSTFGNDISIELLNDNNHGGENTEHVKVLLRIYESLIKKNELIGWCSKKMLSLQEEQKIQEERQKQFKCSVDELNLLIQTKDESLRELRSIICSLENEVKGLKKESDDLTNHYEKSKSCYEETVTRCETENNTLRLDLKATEEKFNTQIQQLEKDNDILRNRVKNLESDLNTVYSSNEEVKGLKQKCDALTDEIHNYEETISRCEMENNNLKLDINRSKETFNTQIQQLEKDNDALRNRVKSFESQLSTNRLLESEIKRLEEKSDALTNEVRKHEETIARYEREIDNLKLDKETSNRQIQELEKDNHILRDRVKSFESQLSTICLLEDEVKRLKEKSDAFADKIHNYEKNKSQYEETINRYETENNGLKLDVKRTKETFNTQIQQLEKENDALRNRVKSFESQLSTNCLLEGKIKILKEKSDALTNEVRKHEETIARYEVEINSLKLDIKRTKETLSTQIQQLEKDNVALRNRIKSFESQLETVARYETENNNLKLEIKRIKETCNIQVRELQQDNDILRDKVKSSESQLNTICVLKEEVEALKKKSEVLTSKIYNYEKNVSDYEGTIARYEMENKTLKLDIKRNKETFNMQLAELEKDNNTLRNRLNRLESQSSVSEHNLNSTQNEEGISIKEAKFEPMILGIINYFVQDTRALLLQRVTQEEREKLKCIRKDIKDFHTKLRSQYCSIQNKETVNTDEIKDTLLKVCMILKEYSNLEKSSLKSQIELLEKDNKTYLREICALKKTLEETDTNCSDCDLLKTKLSEMTHSLSSKDRMLTETLSKLQGVQQQLLTKSAQENFCFKCDDYKTAYLDLRKLVSGEMAKNRKLQNELDKKIKIKRDEFMDGYRRHNANLERELKEKESELLASEAKYNELMNKYSELQEQLTVQIKKVADCESSKRNPESGESQLQRKYNDLKIILRSRRQELAAKGEKIEELTAQVSELQRQLEMRNGVKTKENVC